MSPLASLSRIVLLAAFAVCASAGTARAEVVFKQTNLVSDQVRVGAKITDENLVNAWGIAFLPTGPFWIANNGTGTLTIYLSNGGHFPTQPSQPLVVTVPTPSGTGQATPTGLTANTGMDFVVSANGKSGASLFLVATEDGTISGWNPTVDPTHAILKVDRSPQGAVYKGAALLTPRGSSSSLYATDFHNGHVDQFDGTFQLVHSFTDDRIPDGFAPFGIAAIGDQLWVTFAKQKLPDRHDDDPAVGNGFVDVFGSDGTLMRRFASNGKLDSPWGLAVAPAGFGRLSNALLVGNFGDGHILAFEKRSGRAIGRLRDTQCNPLQIDGLWSLTFGNDFLAGEPDILYFTAGPNEESHGLFGKLKVSRAGCDLDDDDDQPGHGDGHGGGNGGGQDDQGHGGHD